MPLWKRLLAMVLSAVGAVLGAAMAVQWQIGGGGGFSEGPPGADTVGVWMSQHLPLMDAQGEPAWIWRGPFFLSLALVLPFVWEVTTRVPSSAARRCTRGALLVATSAIALEYSSPGYGWLIDLAALLVAIGGTVACGISGLRKRALSPRIAWSLIAVLPLTPIAGFLTFWYLPPGLTMGLLLSWAMAAALQPRAPTREAGELQAVALAPASPS